MTQSEFPTVAVLVFKKKNILLVKHGEKAQHITGAYGLPGGRIQEGEGYKAAAARELQEETGIKVSISDLHAIPTVFHAIIPRKHKKIINVSWHVYLAKRFSGRIRKTNETAPEWVPIIKVSKLDLLPNTESAIKEGLKKL